MNLVIPILFENNCKTLLKSNRSLTQWCDVASAYQI